MNWQVTVIADNCDDDTAQVARNAGARVLERFDEKLRGKGYALAWALDKLLDEEPLWDAFVIMDADSVLNESFLHYMNLAMDNGDEVIQARYNVLNKQDSWRTRMMECALTLVHHVKPRGRMALGLSDGLKGNGMCFSRRVMTQIPWSGDSITEDIEYTLRLVESGVRVRYVEDAIVSAQMPTDSTQAVTQRERWESGRYALLGRAIKLAVRALIQRKKQLFDRAVELIIPPFAELFIVPIFMIGIGFIWCHYAPSSMMASKFIVLWSILLAGQVVYLFSGLWISRVPLKVALSLLFSPVYIFWKLGIYVVLVLKRGAGGWIRTERRRMS